MITNLARYSETFKQMHKFRSYVSKNFSRRISFLSFPSLEFLPLQTAGVEQKEEEKNFYCLWPEGDDAYVQRLGQTEGSPGRKGGKREQEDLPLWRGEGTGEGKTTVGLPKKRGGGELHRGIRMHGKCKLQRKTCDGTEEVLFVSTQPFLPKEEFCNEFFLCLSLITIRALHYGAHK